MSIVCQQAHVRALNVTIQKVSYLAIHTHTVFGKHIFIEVSLFHSGLISHSSSSLYIPTILSIYPQSATGDIWGYGQHTVGGLVNYACPLQWSGSRDTPSHGLQSSDSNSLALVTCCIINLSSPTIGWSITFPTALPIYLTREGIQTYLIEKKVS